MKKAYALIIGFVLLFGCITTNQGVEVYEKIEKSIVQVGDGHGPSGTGFFYTSKGYIITCQHIIDDMDHDDIYVMTKDGKLHKVDVIGHSAEKDLAVLKLVDVKDVNITPIKFTSKKVRVGQTVYMYGHPRGEAFTLTKGIVSKIKHDFSMSSYTNYKAIQTDAEMNLGNSGGILVNTEGYLIGVTSAMYSQNGVGMGLNIAVHIDEIKKVVKRIFYNEKQGKKGHSIDSEVKKREPIVIEEVLEIGE